VIVEFSVPAVSILVPVFNERPSVLRDSLESIVEQTFSNFECLVIDESTESQSSEICAEVCDRDSRFKHIRPSSRLGLAGSLNLGIQSALGGLIARADSDDICARNRLELQVSFLNANKEVDIVGCCLEIVDTLGRTIAFRDYPLRHSQIAKRFQFTTPVAHPALLMRRSVFERHGSYDSSFKYAEDLDMFLRFLNGGVVFANIPQRLLAYRQDDPRRSIEHWKMAIRARLTNFSQNFLFYRIIGLFLIFGWLLIPNFIKKNLFYRLTMSNKRPNFISGSKNENFPEM
jgi:glycosyltransferase involved in cell wall biosynthesis